MMVRRNVFRGTVFGPPLWNSFYEDSRHAARCLEFLETVFADDFNCWKKLRFETDVTTTHILAHNELRAAQRELHLWGGGGVANRVVFDPSK